MQCPHKDRFLHHYGRVVRIILLAVFAVCLHQAITAPGYAQSSKKYTSKSIKKRERELTNLKSEIRKYEKKLAKTKSLEKNTLNRIDNIDRQTALIRRLVNRLNDKIAQNQQEIEIAQSGLKQAEIQLGKLQQTYSRYIISVYKQGRTHDTELLLSSKSLNQMIIRSRYLKAMTQKHRVEADEIRQAKRAIETQKKILEEKLALQVDDLGQRKKDQKLLNRRENEQRGLLSKARKNKSTYRKHLQRKQRAAAKVKKLISDLIAKERKRRSSAGAKGSKSGGLASLPSKPISQTAFGKLKGRLPWPVRKGRVVESFGEQLQTEHELRVINNGIDIEVPEGTSVRSVADGKITSIMFIPGYENIVIINHGDEFMTVYAHIKSISVKEKQKVKAGHVIGKSKTGISGPQVHFEIWRYRDKFNPVTWLARR
jgi:murein hydrolase activator